MNKVVPIPSDELKRLEALKNYMILDTSPEIEFDEITQLASYICQAPIALISLLDEERQWFKSSVGLDAKETPRDISFCQYAIMDNDLFEVNNALENLTFKDNPLVVGSPDIRFYAGAPLTTTEGLNIGTLCVIDSVPRSLNDEQKKALKILAKHVISKLELRRKNSHLGKELESLMNDRVENISFDLNAYKNALDETAIVGITDKRGKIIYANEKFCQISKYSREELLGQDHRLINSGFHSKDFFKDFWETISSGKVWKGEIKNKAKDGSFYWVATSIVPFLDKNNNMYQYVAIRQDITETKLNDIELQKFFGLSQDIMVVAKPTGHFAKISQSLVNLLGFTHEELLKQSFYDFIHPDDIKPTSDVLEKLALGALVVNFEARFRKSNGEFLILSWNASPDPETGLLYATARDVTNNKKEEQELIEAKNLAEQAVFAKDSFLANMSHEIRTPMNAIIGFTDILLQSKPNEEQKEYIEIVKTAGENLLSIINNILDLSKIESGNMKLDLAPFNFNEVLKHSKNLFKKTAQEKGLNFEMLVDSEIPDFLVGDKVKLGQILINLIGNAIKFTEKGGVTVFIKKGSYEKGLLNISFILKDTGIGIAQEKQDIIFDRFTQADNDTTRRFGGTGLGLNIAKLLIKLQGGELQMKSELGTGTEFSFNLSFQKIDRSIVEPIQEKLAPKHTLGQIRILLCEDNLINQKLAKNVIEKFGFDIDIANNGREGVEKAEKNYYDLILMDLQMPEMDGYQATQYIRETLKLDIPIVAITAHSLVGEQAKCDELGMTGYVAKPFKQEDLYNAILAALRKPKQETAMVDDDPIYPKDDAKKSGYVNMDYLVSLSGGNRGFEKEMVELFLKQVPIDIEQLRKAMLNDDLPLIRKIAHKVKSSMGVFGLDELVEIFKFMEENEECTKVEIQIHMEKVDVILKAVYVELRSILVEYV